MTDDSPFKLPPVTDTEDGHERTVGFEIELSGLELEQIAGIVSTVFGGTAEESNAFVHHVHGTAFGDFKIELDAAILKNQRYTRLLAPSSAGTTPHGEIRSVEELLKTVAATVVPYEIVAPPLPITCLRPIETLRLHLQQRGATGTAGSPLHAFGLHINPQVPRCDPRAILQVLQAFVLLEPWLREVEDLDLARRMLPFIDEYPAGYIEKILDADYQPTMDALITDYLEWNSTRNHSLDMLPLFAWIDPARVNTAVDGGKTIAARPTFHYRMPNCRIGQPDWTIAREWNQWVLVEELAAIPQQLDTLRKRFFERRESLLDRLTVDWAREVGTWLGQREVSGR